MIALIYWELEDYFFKEATPLSRSGYDSYQNFLGPVIFTMVILALFAKWVYSTNTFGRVQQQRTILSHKEALTGMELLVPWLYTLPSNIVSDVFPLYRYPASGTILSSRHEFSLSSINKLF